ncbi:hypothetical protein LOTGIDRAFT_229821 [Lottia gigantea]|uniref:MARVEL domain-containing protein n=1 Tax=Lottia gigantea TaxID=225164 RepID=V3ZKA3_LOTGI|nr:hypothetical protein LOTGIDRAFT_229821 [Lottia gigantea]ESO82805.1 hypothetical protein LOTGIDRAFT_229821 [Lottia gigantea]
MSTTYEQTTVTQSSSSGVASSIRPDVLYVKSIPGILKIVEMILCLIVLICASVGMWWLGGGGGWVQFVAALAFVVTIILFIFHFMHIIEKLPGPWVLIEFIFYIVITIMWLIAAIVAAARIGGHGSVIATAFFAFAATAVYAVDTFFMFRGWKGGVTTTTSSSTAGGTTTTTTTQYETRTQY